MLAGPRTLFRANGLEHRPRCLVEHLTRPAAAAYPHAYAQTLAGSDERDHHGSNERRALSRGRDGSQRLQGSSGRIRCRADRPVCLERAALLLVQPRLARAGLVSVRHLRKNSKGVAQTSQRLRHESQRYNVAQSRDDLR